MTSKLRAAWSLLDRAIGFSIGGATTLLGVFALYFFIVSPIMTGLSPHPTEVILAIGIFGIGAGLVAHTVVGTRSLMWFALAQIPLWFLLYSIAFEVERPSDPAPSLHTLVHGVAMAILFVVFAWLGVAKRKQERAERGP